MLEVLRSIWPETGSWEFYITLMRRAKSLEKAPALGEVSSSDMGGLNSVALGAPLEDK